ncbi:hypothetical protein BU24DRAFT_453012 [Aaosphaeria arxii CBS 175.79]|uniref:Uncharacterized protein n=1 Tax=Aaosphaeria arxii CBS 175.79 TaxID=1450172 RepID=A0A6A5XII4_9PLEO|nr:uncharacterized protein BU24DRAFT_453012 [Aaosphaeria arxii CBS 175.79]KAF2012641.1 hypothetical protein BU24DRAFT_453012 [Aaosphaeria arxii CBS 175.79]
MPMNWSAENDRILLMKLVETHRINIDASDIAQAWPTNTAHQPSARAISERFVKLRKMNGGKENGAKITVARSGGKPRTPKLIGTITPSSSAKKRKQRKSSSEESDADDHITDDDSPSKRKATSTRKHDGRSSIPVPSTPTTVKKHRPQSLSQSPEFREDARRARELSIAANAGRTPSFLGVLGTTAPMNFSTPAFDFTSAMPTPHVSRHNSFDASFVGNSAVNFAMLPDQGSFNMAAMGAANDMNMSFDGIGHIDQNMLNQPGMDFSGMNFDFSMPMNNADQQLNPNPRQPRPKYELPTFPMASTNSLQVPEQRFQHQDVMEAPSSPPSQRARSARSASKAANEHMTQWIQDQKEQNHEYGEKSSEEDSQASEFEDDDAGDYV